MTNPNELLADLVKALDEAYISSWQSTADWRKQLDAARTYVQRLREMERDIQAPSRGPSE